MLANFLGGARENRQIDGYLGHGVRGGMLVNVNDGRMSFHVRPHLGAWKKVFETALPRAAYRLKYAANPGGAIELLGVRPQRCGGVKQGLLLCLLFIHVLVHVRGPRRRIIDLLGVRPQSQTLRCIAE